MMQFMKRLSRAFRREEGTSTVEFVLCIPAFMMIFMMSFESGMFMTKSVLLDRAVDMTIRDLRLGRIVNPTSAKLKAEICDKTVIISECVTSIMIELAPINQTTWVMPATSVTCIDRDQAIQPLVTMDVGSDNEIMLVRVCILVDSLFPRVGLGKKLVKGNHGEIGLIAVSAFVNEPS
jgi:TadE-like protein